MEIKRIIDELTIETWHFMFIDGNIYLNHYEYSKRESIRHRVYHTIKRYDRIMRRESNIQEDEVPLTEELKQQVLQQFMSSISVMRWNERKL